MGAGHIASPGWVLHATHSAELSGGVSLRGCAHLNPQRGSLPALASKWQCHHLRGRLFGAPTRWATAHGLLDCHNCMAERAQAYTERALDLDSISSIAVRNLERTPPQRIGTTVGMVLISMRLP